MFSLGSYKKATYFTWKSLYSPHLQALPVQLANDQSSISVTFPEASRSVPAPAKIAKMAYDPDVKKIASNVPFGIASPGSYTEWEKKGNRMKKR